MLLLTLALAATQPKFPRAPVVPPPPVLTAPAICGGSVGDKVTITFTGKNLANPKEIYLGESPVAAIFSKTTAESCTAEFQVPKLNTGPLPLRLLTNAGISNLRSFALDALPAVQSEGRTKREAAQKLNGVCTVAGKTIANESDYYRFSVKAGDSRSFEVVSRRLGSPMDPTITIYDVSTGKPIKALYADDTPGLLGDARLQAHRFDRDGEILVEVRDAQLRGGTDYSYFLRVGRNSGPAFPFPLVATRDVETTIHFSDINPDIGTVQKFPFALLIEPEIIMGEGVVWPVVVRVSAMPEGLEHEPNDDPKTAGEIPVPGGISARFGKSNDRDCFAIQLKKGDKIRVSAEAAEFGLPTEATLKLLDVDGKELVKSDPAKPPVTFDFTAAAADGRFVIVAENANFAGGPNEVYHLSVQKREPDATVSLASDRVMLPGKLGVSGVVRSDYDGPIELKWVGAAAIRSTATIPAKTNPTGAAPYLIPLEAAPNAKPGVYFGRILSQVKGRPVQVANTTESLKQAFPNLTVLPAELNGVIAVVVPDRP